MSSTNDELAPPPKRASPLDYRNTDLVSRLLAATPPYLYNMPLVPNSYFFSEMLRSLVQAKSENARTQANLHHRRSRKRSWTQSRPDFYQKESPKLEKPEMLSPAWPHKPPEKSYEPKKLEHPLDKHPPSSNGLKSDYETPQLPGPNFLLDKPEIPTSSANMPMMFPIPNQDTTSNMMLPPPPPMWYPPLYPSSYGIDPLHFFIDLRVSGHIYDKKNSGKEAVSTPSIPMASEADHAIEPPKDIFRQSRHASAFSVPVPSLKNLPMNLSSRHDSEKETKSMKFDVKSMGFDKGSNKTSTHYVMPNVAGIYKHIAEEAARESEQEEIKSEGQKDGKEETEEERLKRVRDLKALIGLELVVDYMNHAKPGQPPQASEESSTDFESAGSPAVEVVALQDETSQEI